MIATMRKPSSDAGQEQTKLQNVIVVALDVTGETSIKDAVKAGLDKFGTIHVVVNNAGFRLSGPLELAKADQLDLHYKTNLIGPILFMQPVLSMMRAAKSGLIINVSSTVGRIALPLSSLYVGCKSGLEGVSEAAAIELAPFGIRVRLVEPGAVHTDFSGRSMPTTVKSCQLCYKYIPMEGVLMPVIEPYIVFIRPFQWMKPPILRGISLYCNI